ncbi:unnamed protein product [Gordionus sp. m RMFG-2023]
MASSGSNMPTDDLMEMARSQLLSLTNHIQYQQSQISPQTNTDCTRYPNPINNSLLNPENSSNNIDSAFPNESDRISLEALKWAKGLDNLLRDEEGVRSFTRYLRQEGISDYSLMFVFACRGLKKRNNSIPSGAILLQNSSINNHNESCNENNCENNPVTTVATNSSGNQSELNLLRRRVKAIYRSFLRSSAPGIDKDLLPITSDCRKHIRDKINRHFYVSNNGDHNQPPINPQNNLSRSYSPIIADDVFDEALDQVESHIARTSYLAFLKSDHYLSKLRGEEENSENSQHHHQYQFQSIGDFATANQNQLSSICSDHKITDTSCCANYQLPTLHEDSELDLPPTFFKSHPQNTESSTKHQTISNRGYSIANPNENFISTRSKTHYNPSYSTNVVPSAYMPDSGSDFLSTSETSGSEISFARLNRNTNTTNNKKNCESLENESRKNNSCINHDDYRSNSNKSGIPKPSSNLKNKCCDFKNESIEHHTNCNNLQTSNSKHTHSHKASTGSANFSDRAIKEMALKNSLDPDPLTFIPKMTQPANTMPPSDPKVFAALLTSKLNFLIKDSEKTCKLERSLKRLQLCPSTEVHTIGTVPAEFCRIAEDPNNKTDETSQSILDDHVSRVWKDDNSPPLSHKAINNKIKNWLSHTHQYTSNDTDIPINNQYLSPLINANASTNATNNALNIANVKSCAQNASQQVNIMSTPQQNRPVVYNLQKSILLNTSYNNAPLQNSLNSSLNSGNLNKSNNLISRLNNNNFLKRSSSTSSGISSLMGGNNSACSFNYPLPGKISSRNNNQSVTNTNNDKSHIYSEGDGSDFAMPLNAYHNRNSYLLKMNSSDMCHNPNTMTDSNGSNNNIANSKNYILRNDHNLSDCYYESSSAFASEMEEENSVVAYNNNQKISNSNQNLINNYDNLKETNSKKTVIGYYFCNEPVPYRTKISGADVTLKQFKALLSKKGNYRYYFKKSSDEFHTGVINEEISDEEQILPLWEGKIFAKVESLE